MGNELVKFHEHKAAVKAIGWCPSNPSMLASGGGTADRHIRFFSTQSLSQNYSIDTGTLFFYSGSQICNLVFSKISNEMITTHGYSLNQINLWNTASNWEEKSVNKVTTLTGHTYRVLYLAMSPSGESILTGAGDETLRFWNVFDSSQYKKHETLSFQMDLR
jgi:cell division cycle 20-like protein 1, cofactor of APC complex